MNRAASHMMINLIAVKKIYQIMKEGKVKRKRWAQMQLTDRILYKNVSIY